MIAVGLENFANEVWAEDGPVIVDFFADYCGPCRQMKPMLEQINASGYKVVTVDIAKEQELAQHFKISMLPTMVVFNGKEEVTRFVGVQPQRVLMEAVDKARASLV